MVCSVAGITSDANVLTNELRLIAQRYLLQYGESIPCEQLVSWLCDVKQAYTQYGGEIIFVFLELGASHHFKGGILAPVWFKWNCMEHYLEKEPVISIDPWPALLTQMVDVLCSGNNPPSTRYQSVAFTIINWSS